MAKQVFLTVSLETGKAVTNVKELKDTIKLMKKELESSTDPKRYAELESSIKKANSEVKAFNKSLQEGKGFSERITGAIKDGFKGIGVAIVGAFAVSKIIEFGKASLETYNTLQRNELKLKSALDGREDVTKRLIKLSEQLQTSTGVDDRVIQSQQIFLATQGRTEAQINKTVEAAIRLSKVTGQDLTTVVQQLDATFEGNIGKLSKLDSGFKNLTDNQLANGGAIDLINEKYAEQLTQMTDVDRATTNYASAVENLEKNFGKLLAKSAPILNFLSDAANGIVEIFRTDIDRKIDINVELTESSKQEALDDFKNYRDRLLKDGKTFDEATKQASLGSIKILNNLIKDSNDKSNILIYAAQKKALQDFLISEETDRKRALENKISQDKVNADKLAKLSQEQRDKLKLQIDIELKDSITRIENETLAYKKGSVERLQSEIDAQKKITEAKKLSIDKDSTTNTDTKTNLKLKADEEAALKTETLTKELVTKLLEIEKEGLAKSLEGKIEGSAEALEIQKNSLEQQRQIELNSAGDNASKKLEINTRYNTQLNKLNKDLIAELNATSKGDLEREKVALESKLRTVEKGSDEELKLKADLEKNKIALEKNAVDQLIIGYENRVGGINSLNKRELEDYHTLLNNKAALDEQYQTTKVEKTKLSEQDITNAVVGGLDLVGQAIQNSLDNQTQARAIQTEQAITKINEQSTAELQALDIAFQKQQGTYVAKTAAEKKYEADRQKILDKAKKEERDIKIKQWQADKKAAITSALINTALSVTQALASSPPPASFILAGLSLAAGLIQVSAISNQPQPNFKRGGIPKKNDGGILSGPSHSDGGIQASVGGSPIELEGGEIILNKGVNANPKLRGIASELNSVTGGVSFGSSDHNIRSMIRSNMYAMGGIARPSLRYDVGGIAGSAPVNVQNSIDFSEMRSFLQSELDKPRRSYVIESDITSSQNQTSVIERRAKLS